jgi:hypothetical protein
MAQRAQPDDLASVMWPSLSRETKAREAALEREVAQRRAAEYRAQLYRQINACADERLRREANK